MNLSKTIVRKLLKAQQMDKQLTPRRTSRKPSILTKSKEVWVTPNRPINIVPANIARLKLPGKSLENPHGPGNSTPLNSDCARVQPSESHNVSREIKQETYLLQHFKYSKY